MMDMCTSKTVGDDGGMYDLGLFGDVAVGYGLWRSGLLAGAGRVL